MRVYVVGTGRCGSVTIAAALKETVTNLTVGHETFANGHPSNMAYPGLPDDHIEVDHRLTFHLGPILLDVMKGEAIVVWLRRNTEAVVRSWLRRFKVKGGMMRSWANGVAYFRPELRSADDLEHVARSYVTHVERHLQSVFECHEGADLVRLHIEKPEPGLRELWKLAGLEGDLDRCLELATRYLNKSHSYA